MYQIILIHFFSLAVMFFIGFKVGSAYRLKKDVKLFNKFIRKKIKQQEDE
tara:strand:+ start:391 stop:540 length:150 start_codon:yes stop_codon:yes gene_type:complete